MEQTGQQMFQRTSRLIHRGLLYVCLLTCVQHCARLDSPLVYLHSDGKMEDMAAIYRNMETVCEVKAQFVHFERA